jgi:hypothetical protein
LKATSLPGTLGPLPLVGAGYFLIIAAAVAVGGLMIARSHWLVWGAAGGLAAAAMGGYVLTRSRPTAFALLLRPAAHRIRENRIPENSHVG